MAARVMVLCDAVDEAEPVLSAVLDGGRARGAVATVATAAALRAEARARVGRLAEAESDAREALDIASEHGLGVVVPVVVGVLVELLLDRAPAAEAVELVARFADVRVPAGYPESAMRYARGRAAAAAGDVELAVAELAACRAGQRDWGEVNPARYPSRTQLALALVGAGRADEAPALADEEVELARRFGAARAVGIALRGRALLGRGEARIEGLREAASVLGASPARLEHARTLLELGAALRRSGQRVEARSVLSAALDGCHACGAHVLADRARAELRAAGARPRRERLSGVEALTAGELRVAELAARGLTNRQIAQTLFVTSKTVETHLGHVYPKLAIAGRSELGEKLQGAAPDAPVPVPVGRSLPFLDQGRTGGEGEVDLHDAVRLRRSGSGRG
jgi:DNA-binding CsgD family transcriptional regulator